MSDMDWEPVIGLEVHVQLATRSKIFSSAPVDAGGLPNHNANLLDVAMPGTLPVLNREAVVMAVKFGLAINAHIASVCRFDRKNYFYPDLPKGYQISQLNEPVVGRGELDVVLEDGSVTQIGVTRAHLEEDAGKSIHDQLPDGTGIDLNRAGTPLLEIVTEPDIRSAHQAALCFRQLHALVTWLGICDGDLSQGSMRCDANVSVRRRGDSQFGERTEIKNINSFRFVERALEFEIDRQVELLEAGHSVVRETRQYDAARHRTLPMRGKESSDDYRYFPDPDLLPLRISEAFIESVRETMTELPQERLQRFATEFGIRANDAARLTATKAMADYFEELVSCVSEPQRAANWQLGDLSAALNRHELTIDRSRVAAPHLGALIRKIEEGTVSTTQARQVFEEVWNSGEDVDAVIDRLGFIQEGESTELIELVSDVIQRHSEQVAQLRAGKTKVLGFLVGQVMKRGEGIVDPKRVNELLRERLKV